MSGTDLNRVNLPAATVREAPAPEAAASAGQAPAAGGLSAAAIDAAIGQNDQRLDEAARLPKAGRVVGEERYALETAALEAFRPRIGENAYSVAKATRLLNQVDDGLMGVGAALKEIRDLRAALRPPTQLDVPTELEAELEAELAAKLETEREAFQGALDSLAALEKTLLTSPLKEAAQLTGTPQMEENRAIFVGELEDLQEAETPAECRAIADHLRSLQNEVLESLGQLGGQEAGRLSANLRGAFEYLIHIAEEKEIRSQSLANLTQTATDLGAFQEAIKIVASGSVTREEALTAFNELAETLNRPELALPSGASLKEVRLALLKLKNESALEPKPEDLANLNAVLLGNDNFALSLEEVAREIDEKFQTLTNDHQTWLKGLKDELEKEAVDLLALINPRGDAGATRTTTGTTAPTGSDLNAAIADLVLRAEIAGLPPEDFRRMESVAETVATLAAAKKDWAEGKDGVNTDTLSLVMEEAAALLAELPKNGLTAERLANHLADFAGFIDRRVQELSTIANGIVADCLKAEDLTEEGLLQLTARLDDTVGDITRDGRIGETLTKELILRLGAGRDAVSLAYVNAALQRVEAGQGDLAEIQAWASALPDGSGRESAQKRIQEFSAKQLERIKAETAKLDQMARQPNLENPGNVAAGVKARLEALLASAAKVLAPSDRQEAETGLEKLRASAPEALARAVIERLGERFKEKAGLNSDSQRRAQTREEGLAFLLSASFASDLLVQALGREKTRPLKNLLLLAGEIAEAQKNGQPVALEKIQSLTARLETIGRGRPALDQTLLDLKLTLNAGLESPEVTTAKHAHSRVKEALFRRISDEAPEIVDFLGLNTAEDLNLTNLEKLVRLTPNFDQSPFNVLLIKALWNEYRLSGDPIRPDNEATMTEFRNMLPQSLAERGNAVIRGLFQLGLENSRILDDAQKWIRRAESMASFPDVRLLLDNFTATDPDFRLHRALTVEARNFLIAVGQGTELEGKPLDELLELVGQAFNQGLDQSSLAERAVDRLRSVLGLTEGDLSETTFEAQIFRAAGHLKAVQPEYDRLIRSVAELRAALETIQENVIEAPNLDPGQTKPNPLPSAKSIAKTSGPEKAELEAKRQQVLADPTDFLYRQNAVKVIDGQPRIMAKKVQGETMSLGLLAFHDLLSDEVEALPRPRDDDGPEKAQAVLKALKSLQLPNHFNLKQMRPVRTKGDNEGEALLRKMKFIQALDENDPDLAIKLKILGGELLEDMETYNLPAKARTILAYKIPGDTAAVSYLQNPTGLGDIIKTAIKDGSTQNLDRTAVKAGKALEHGLAKALGPADQSSGPEADRLRDHLMKRLISIRGAGANQQSALKAASSDEKSQILAQARVLLQAVNNLSAHNLDALSRLGHVAVMASLEEINAARKNSGATSGVDYGDVAAELRVYAENQTPERSPLYNNAFQTLTTRFGLPPEAATLVLEVGLLFPLRDSDAPGAVLENIIDGTSASLGAYIADVKAEIRLSSSERKARDAQVMTAICERMVDQLAPDSAMSVNAKNALTLGGSAQVGAVKVGAAIQVASETGLAVSLDNQGRYQVAISLGLSGGLGLSAGFDAVVGDMEASLGASLGSNQGYEFTFPAKENCVEFLSKIFSGMWTPDDAATLCSGLATFDSLEGGVALSATLELGQVKVMGNKAVAFEAGFEAEVHHQRRTTEDQTAGLITTEQASSGQITLSCNIAKVDIREEGPETAKEKQEALDGLRNSAQETMSVAQGGVAGVDSSEIGDASVSVQLGDSANLTAGVGLDREGITLAARFSAASRSSLTRANSGLMMGATVGSRIDFAGPAGPAGLGAYLSAQCHLPSRTVDEIVGNVTRQLSALSAEDFTLITENTLKPETLARCRALEMEIADLSAVPGHSREISAKRSAVEKLLADRANYEPGELRITPSARSDSMSLSVLAFSREVAASDERTIRYDNSSGLLNPTPIA